MPFGVSARPGSNRNTIGFGYDFGSFTERFEKLEEALQIVKSMFTNHTTSFDGKWFTVRDAYNVPKPIQAAVCPCSSAAAGSARHCGWSLSTPTHATFRRRKRRAPQTRGSRRTLRGVSDAIPKAICRTRLGTLIVGRTHEEAIAERDAILGARGLTWDQLPSEMQTALSNTFLLGGPDEVREQVQAFLDAGLDGLVFNMPGVPDPDTIASAGEVLTPVLLR